MTDWVVTIKLKRNPLHNPRNKKTGKCKFSDLCTDVTGAHHSFIVEGREVREIKANILKEFPNIHITRIEMARRI